MGSPTSVTTQNPEQPPKKGGTGSRGTTAPVDAVVNASYSAERPSKGQWYSEAPPTEALTWVLGELAFYYGACCLYHRSTPTQGQRRPYY